MNIPPEDEIPIRTGNNNLCYNQNTKKMSFLTNSSLSIRVYEFKFKNSSLRIQVSKFEFKLWRRTFKFQISIYHWTTYKGKRKQKIPLSKNYIYVLIDGILSLTLISGPYRRSPFRRFEFWKVPYFLPKLVLALDFLSPL